MRTKKLYYPGLRDRLTAYLREHYRTLVLSLSKLYSTPFSSIMTIAVIGIALALPCGMYLLLLNLQSIAGEWDQATQITLYLEQNVTDDQVRGLENILNFRAELAKVEFTSAEQALTDFREHSGLADVIDSLDKNPLPATFKLYPTESAQAPAALQALTEELQAIPEVEHAQLDMQWLQRLYSLMDIARRISLMIAVMLAISVLLVVGNTIRLDIQNRREEIEVTKLIGGTNAFIRRPFLYGGLCYGILGGLLALLITQVALVMLAHPVKRLAGLYSSDYQLSGLGVSGNLLLILLSLSLGWIGSWLAVTRHLGKIEPS